MVISVKKYKILFNIRKKYLFYVKIKYNIYLEYENIIVEKKEKVGIVTLNRPKQLNALNSKLLEEIVDALKIFDKEEEEIGAIVLTGSKKAFAGF